MQALENGLILFGLFLVNGSAAAVLLGTPLFALASFSLTLAGEDVLRSRFGEGHARYCREVNRYLPSLPGLGATLRSRPFDWKRLLRKEYGSTSAWSSFLLFLLGWERRGHLGAAEMHRLTWAPVISWSPLLLGHATIRILKKRCALGRG